MGGARRCARVVAAIGAVALSAIGLAVTTSGVAGGITVSDEANLRAEFQDPIQTEITLDADITLTDCAAGDLDRGFIPGTLPLVLDGAGFVITQTCPERVIDFEGADLTLRNITITGGTQIGENGGGISIGDDGNPSLIVEGSTITGNQVSGLLASGNGGGIDGSDTTGNITVTNSTISNNEASGGGGGIFGSPGTVTINSSTISGNSAGGDGGGIDLGPFAAAQLDMTNSTVTQNSAAGVGGGVNANNAVITYSTITSNTAPDGSNLFGDIPTYEIFGTIVAQGQGGDDCAFNSPPTNTSVGFNFSDENTCAFTQSTDINDGGDPDLGALGANGGPTNTLLPQEGSPVIDQIPAHSPCAGVNIVVDQRGEPRPIVAGELCDIGAVEVQQVDPVPTPTTTAPPPAVVIVPTFTG